LSEKRRAAGPEALADRRDQGRVERCRLDDALGHEEQGAGIGVEIALVAQSPLELDDDLALDARVPLGQIAIEAVAGGEDGDAGAAGVIDEPVAEAGGARDAPPS
jgi:hypothetical protein